MTVYVNASYADLSRDSDSNLAPGNISQILMRIWMVTVMHFPRQNFEGPTGAFC